MKKIAIIGSAISGGASQIIDAAQGTDCIVTSIFDRDEQLLNQNVFNVPIVGTSEIENILYHYKQNLFDCAVIAIGGNLKVRESVYNDLKSANIPLANIIDKTAQLRIGVQIGEGNVILGNVYLGPEVVIGNNCYIINNTTIQHHSVVGDHCYFSTSVAIAGRVKIGSRVRFDTASGAKADLKIDNDKFITAGMILKEDFI